MYEIVIVLLLLVSVAVVALILVQQGKGAGMGASFGAGASNTVFGAVGSGNFLTRSTWTLSLVFFGICLLIGYLQKQEGHVTGNFTNIEAAAPAKKAAPAPSDVPSLGDNDATEVDNSGVPSLGDESKSNSNVSISREGEPSVAVEPPAAHNDEAKAADNTDEKAKASDEKEAAADKSAAKDEEKSDDKESASEQKAEAKNAKSDEKTEANADAKSEKTESKKTETK